MVVQVRAIRLAANLNRRVKSGLARVKVDEVVYVVLQGALGRANRQVGQRKNRREQGGHRERAEGAGAGEHEEEGRRGVQARLEAGPALLRVVI